MVSLLERIENPFHHVWFHPDPGIVNIDFETIRYWIGCRDHDLAVLPGKFDRILQAIPNDLLEFRGVSIYKMKAGPEVGPDAQLSGIRFITTNFDHVGYGIVRVQLH